MSVQWTGVLIFIVVFLEVLCTTTSKQITEIGDSQPIENNAQVTEIDDSQKIDISDTLVTENDDTQEKEHNIIQVAELSNDAETQESIKGNNRKPVAKNKGKLLGNERQIHPTKEMKDHDKQTRLKYKKDFANMARSWFSRNATDNKDLGRDQSNLMHHLLGVRARKDRERRSTSGFSGVIRKEYRDLTNQQRHDYHRAVWILKTTPYGFSGTSIYDLITELHHKYAAPYAHYSSCFLPWHRQYLLMYELALQEAVPGVALPYIDSGLEGKLRNYYLYSALFANDTLGNIVGGPVTTGAFANFTPHSKICKGSTIERSSNVADYGLLYTDSKFEKYERYYQYADMSYPTNNEFEKDHGGFHVLLGGHMKDLDCAPCDPAFFMHHCFVDLLWERIRQRYQRTDIRTDYPLDYMLPHPGMRAKAAMIPFGSEYEDVRSRINNIDGLQTSYTDLHYRYTTAPSFIRCTSASQCGKGRMWCYRGKCAAQVREGTWCYRSNPSSCFCENPAIRPRCVYSKCNCEEYRE